MKVLITGGHITPALAVIDAIREDDVLRNADLVVVGRKYVNENESNPSFEYKSVRARNIRFVHLITGRWREGSILKKIVGMLQMVGGLLSSVTILNKEKPDVIVSFGGYIALPVAIAGYLRKIPVITHEQTLIPGKTQRFIAQFAKTVCISFPQSAKYFNTSNIVHTGNPLRKNLFHFNTSELSERAQKQKKPILLVVGGSLGSHSINVLIEEIIPQLSHFFYVVHQVGNVMEFDDYGRLSKYTSETYLPVEHLQEDELGFLYKHADVLVSRSGANTIFEIIACKLPSVLVPLPWSAEGEQQAQAEMLQEKNGARIFDQSSTSEKLLHAIMQTHLKRDTYIHNLEQLASFIKMNATESIVSEIKTHLKNK